MEKEKYNFCVECEKIVCDNCMDDIDLNYIDLKEKSCKCDNSCNKSNNCQKACPKKGSGCDCKNCQS